jgi:molybdopterin-guanine dinucleotide biosynthesis protein A
MTEQNKIAGVVLAGGMARRMGGQDKGLIRFAGRPLIDYAIKSMEMITPQIVISANRHLDQYQAWGYPVISDSGGDYLGPLAGIAEACRVIDADIMLVMPCDSPFFNAVHLQQMLEALSDDVDVVIASDGQRVHPVFMVLKTRLRDSLDAYLAANGRRVQEWVTQQAGVMVEFKEPNNLFANINTEIELMALESRVNLDDPATFL